MLSRELLTFVSWCDSLYWSEHLRVLLKTSQIPGRPLLLRHLAWEVSESPDKGIMETGWTEAQRRSLVFQS